MTRKVVFVIIATLSAACAYAKPPVATMAGVLDSQAGYATQKGLFKADPNGNKLDSFGKVNDTKVQIKIDSEDHGLKYGGLVALNPDTSITKENETSVAFQTMLYVESCIGRLEAGSYSGAYDKLKVSGSTIARATGGVDGDWTYWVSQAIDGQFNALTGAGAGIPISSPSLPTSFDQSYEDKAAKITYYTQDMQGVRAGVSYVPDTDQHGSVGMLKSLTRGYRQPISTYNQTFSYTNVFQGGLSYKGKLSSIGLELSALGEIGHAKKLANGSIISTRHDLRAYELGMGFTYNDFELAASYGSWGKSGLAKSMSGMAVAGAKDGRYWTVGISYVHECIGASIGYFGADNGGFGLSATHPSYFTTRGETNVSSLSVDYRLVPGLLPYAEITQYTLKNVTLGVAGENAGVVLLLGSKLAF